MTEFKGIIRNKTCDNRDIYQVTLPPSVLFTYLIATIEGRITETEKEILLRHGYAGIAQMVYSLTEEDYRRFLEYAVTTDLKVEYLVCCSNDHYGVVLATTKRQVEILCEYLRSLSEEME